MKIAMPKLGYQNYSKQNTSTPLFNYVSLKCQLLLSLSMCLRHSYTHLHTVTHRWLCCDFV